MSETIEQQRRQRGECIECGNQLPEDRSGKRLYCDEACRRRQDRAERRAEAAKADRRKCEHCGGAMTGKRAGARYCSKRCTGSAARLRQPAAEPAGACGHCGATLPPKPRGRRGPAPAYCGPTCKGKARHVRTYVPTPRQTSRPQAQKYKPGHRFDDLVLIERRGKVNGSCRVICRCECGNVRDYNLSNLRNGVTTNCADRNRHPDPRARQAPPADYDSAHKLVRRLNGRASAHLCRCGKQAEQWAYSHADPDVMRDGEGREHGQPFSTDPAHYSPMCRSCHARFDRAHARHFGDRLSLFHHALWLATTTDATSYDTIES
ncbi:hypothetical protein [Micromonospora sp. NPDC007230]|uniref:hypothetical protein n=1 Tax=Micromonospora sp. NPDC007230 TaxID=3364237 RepID=UPI003695B58E